MSDKKLLQGKLHLCREARAGRCDMLYMPIGLRAEILDGLEVKYLSELAVIEANEIANPKRSILHRILSAIKPAWL